MEDVQAIADQAYSQAEQEHKLNCQWIDDWQTHAQRTTDMTTMQNATNAVVGAVAGYMNKIVQGGWNLTHHAGSEADSPAPQGSGSEAQDGTPSARGEPSVFSKVAKPLALAAASAGLTYGAIQYFGGDKESSPQAPSSVFQQLEDEGWHVPPSQ